MSRSYGKILAESHHMKIIKNQHGIIKDELNFSTDKIEKLERDQITLIKDMSDKV